MLLLDENMRETFVPFSNLVNLSKISQAFSQSSNVFPKSSRISLSLLTFDEELDLDSMGYKI